MSRSLSHGRRQIANLIQQQQQQCRPMSIFDHWNSSRVAPAESFITSDVRERVKLRMGNSAPENIAPMTVPQMFKLATEEHANLSALADRRDPVDKGLWTKWSYEQYYEETRLVAKAFLALGLSRFQGVGILGRNSPEWFMSSLAASMAGGLGVGLYNTSTADVVTYISKDSPFDIFCVEDAKELDRVLNGRKISDALPTVKKIVMLAPREQVPDEMRSMVMTWKDLVELGKTQTESGLKAVEQDQFANEATFLIYTSGTTGHPKGAILSHDNLAYTTRLAVRDNLGAMEPGALRVMSYLPASHVIALVGEELLPMAIGGTVYFADANALKGTLVDNLKAIRPTMFVGVPRVFEKIEERLREMGRSASPLKRAVVDWAKRTATAHHTANMGRELKSNWRMQLARKLVLSKIHQGLGLDAVCGRDDQQSFVAVGGAPLKDSTYEYFRSLDILLCDHYGATETTAPVTNSLPGVFHYPGTVGKTGIGAWNKLIDVDANGVGEIACGSRNVFMGYHRDPDKTAESFTHDFWFRTGDQAVEDGSGFITIKGRIKEIIVTSGGKNVAPVPIEDRIKTALGDLISNVVVIGDGEKYLTSLLTFKNEADPATMEPTGRLAPSAVRWVDSVLKTKKHGIETTEDFIMSPHINRLTAAIWRGIDASNARGASNVETVQKFTILPTELTVAGGELSPSMKLKRFFICRKFAEQIAAMYGNDLCLNGCANVVRKAMLESQEEY